MSTPTKSLAVVCAILAVACDTPAPNASPELGAGTIALRGDDDVPVAALDSAIQLTFDNSDLFFFGALSAARTSEGRIAVTNRETKQILVFDPSGRFVRSIGRAGGGPGEFQGLLNVVSIGGDTIAAYDYRMRRVSLFTSDGALIDDFVIQTPPEAATIGPTRLVGPLGSRHMLMWSYARSVMLDPNPPLNVPVQAPLVLFSVDSAGNTITMFGEFEGDYSFSSDATGVPTIYGLAPFGGQTWFGIQGGNPVVLISSAPTYRVFQPDGSDETVYRGSWRARDVTRQDRERLMAIWRPRLKDEKLISLWENTIPETMPYYHGAVVGTDGIVWIEPYETWLEGEDRQYIGYNSTGAAVGRLILQSRDNLLTIGNGTAIVHRYVGDGTESVRLLRYRLGSDH